MRIPKVIILGIAAALLAGVVEAVAQQSISTASSNPSDEQAITVPVGHIGDRVVFGSKWDLGPFYQFTSDFGELGNQLLDGTREGAAYEGTVDSLGTQADETGLLHQVVWLAGSYAWSESGGVAGKEWSRSNNPTAATPIDLSTRDMVGFRFDSRLESHRFFTQEYQDAWGFYSFGPYGGHPYDRYEGAPADVRAKQMAVYHQGATYRVGDELQAYAHALLASDDAVLDNYAPLDVREVDFKSWVAAAGTVGDHPAVNLRTEGCARLDWSPTGTWRTWPDHAYFFGLPTLVPSRTCVTMDQWVSSDLPYPVLTDVHSSVDGSDPMRLITTLAGYEPGTQPIPWTNEPMQGAYRTNDPTLERSPSTQRFPADGQGLQLSYLPSAAMRDVEVNTRLPSFTLWKLQHEQAFLAGLSMEPTGPDGAGRAWSLTYAQPDGQAFVVQTEKASASAPPVQVEVGEISVQPFTLDDFPTGPITFAAAERLRHEYVTTAQEHSEPNNVGWGLRYRGAGIRCQYVEGCEPQTDSSNAQDFPSEIWLGYTSTYETMGRATIRPGAEPNRAADLFVNATTGNMVFAGETAREFSVEPLGVSSQYPAPVLTVTTVNAAPAPDLRTAGLVSVGALALFLFAYFLPAIKFAATQGILLIPGYAKTEKSELLVNKIRDTMMSAIRADPGITAPRLQEITQVAWSTVVYHLRMMERKDLISSVLDGRHRRFFPVEGINWSDRPRIAVLKNLQTRELYDLILQEPGVGPSDLSHRFGVSRSTVYWHMERLEKAGLVGRDRLRLKTVFFANPLQAAAPYDPKAAVEVS